MKEKVVRWLVPLMFAIGCIYNYNRGSYDLALLAGILTGAMAGAELSLWYVSQMLKDMEKHEE